jgi:hypothetical protein
MMTDGNAIYSPEGSSEFLTPNTIKTIVGPAARDALAALKGQNLDRAHKCMEPLPTRPFVANGWAFVVHLSGAVSLERMAYDPIFYVKDPEPTLLEAAERMLAIFDLCNVGVGAALVDMEDAGGPGVREAIDGLRVAVADAAAK